MGCLNFIMKFFLETDITFNEFRVISVFNNVPFCFDSWSVLSRLYREKLIQKSKVWTKCQNKTGHF